MGFSSDSYPPQPGETWASIHTSAHCRIQEVKKNPQNERQQIVVFITHTNDTKESDMPSFLANWKRHKGSSPWFTNLGKLLGG